MVDRLAETGDGLSIVAATCAVLDAEDRGAAELAVLLGVAPPQSWPPEFNGPQTRAWMRQMLAEHKDEPGYGSWYIVADGRLAGICGYKGPPNGNGEVEIGYSVVEGDRRRGVGTGAVRLLVARAFRDPRIGAVIAETIPSRIASQKVLHRCGFALVGRRPHDALGEILRFACLRPGAAG
jgi:[ribosomal protein S5]-alanine N-acetyltransferase